MLLSHYMSNIFLTLASPSQQIFHIKNFKEKTEAHKQKFETTQYYAPCYV